MTSEERGPSLAVSDQHIGIIMQFRPRGTGPEQRKMVETAFKQAVAKRFSAARFQVKERPDRLPDCTPRRNQMVRQAPNPPKQNQFYPFGERPMPPTKNGK